MSSGESVDMDKVTGTHGDAISDRLVQVLAEMAQSAVLRRHRLVRWAVENGVELVDPCACRYGTAAQGCVCNVELRIGPRWMAAAARAVAARRTPGGPPPPRSCSLCRSGDHDLEPTTPIKIAGHDGAELGTSWVAVRGRRSRAADRARMVRAGGLPPGTAARQRDAAGL